MVVYMLYHIYAKKNGDEQQKLIGIYTTDENAKAAIQRLSGQPGFKDHPSGFQIFEAVLDRDDWTEGFISADEATK